MSRVLANISPQQSFGGNEADDDESMDMIVIEDSAGQNHADAMDVDDGEEEPLPIASAPVATSLISGPIEPMDLKPKRKKAKSLSSYYRAEEQQQRQQEHRTAASAMARTRRAQYSPMKSESMSTRSRSRKNDLDSFFDNPIHKEARTCLLKEQNSSVNAIKCEMAAVMEQARQWLAELQKVNDVRSLCCWCSSLIIVSPLF